MKMLNYNCASAVSNTNGKRHPSKSDQVGAKDCLCIWMWTSNACLYNYKYQEARSCKTHKHVFNEIHIHQWVAKLWSTQWSTLSPHNNSHRAQRPEVGRTVVFSSLTFMIHIHTNHHNAAVHLTESCSSSCASCFASSLRGPLHMCICVSWCLSVFKTLLQTKSISSSLVKCYKSEMACQH